MKVIENASLTSLNTLGVTSTAKVLAMLENEDDVQQAINYANKHALSIQVLGGGSNVVLPEFVNSMVLQFVAQDIHVIAEDEGSIEVRVAAGRQWHDWVMYSLAKGWFGLENLAYIPGHVGAAPVQNIGAYGVEVKSFITQVHGFNLKTQSVFTLCAEECEFGYRESIFKQALDNLTLITHVDFKLYKQPNVNVSYAPLNDMAAKQGVPTPIELASWVIAVRQSKLPDPKDLPNAGSFFKNPVISSEQFGILQKQYPNIPFYAQEKGVKVPAGWLIDQLGLKGEYFGSVQVHEKQALVLVNHGGSGESVLETANEIKRRVKLAYDIELEQEPRIVN